MMTVIKSLWMTPGPGEADAPEKRIVHAKLVRFRGMTSHIRIGFREGQGYFKCGSDVYTDALQDADIYVERDGRLELFTALRDLAPSGRECIWYTLPEATHAVCVVARRSRVDGLWPCYNIARDGIVIEGSEPAARQGRRTLLQTERGEDVPLPDEVAFRENAMTARWTTPFYAIDLRKKSAGCARFVCDTARTGKLQGDLLRHVPLMLNLESDYPVQGPVLYPLGAGEVSNCTNIALTGRTVIGANSLTYHLRQKDMGLAYSLCFTVEEDTLRIRLDVHAERECRFALLSLFRMAFNSEMTPPVLLGVPELCGETGRITLEADSEAILHFPRYGSIRCTGSGIALRMTSVRDEHINVLDITLPHTDLDDGTVCLPAGDFKGQLTLHFPAPAPCALRSDAPPAVKEALERHAYTALPFRMDTASFTNNGSSMGAPICMDVWTEICEAIGNKRFPAVSAMMGSTLELWLLGAPAYASGWFSDRSHQYEDEYLMTGTSALAGLGRWLCTFADEAWFNRFRPLILEKLQEAKRRVPDGDGIPVSPYRRGISGESQWSTAWYDVISYGWKDAFSAAILYRGLLLLEKGFARFGDGDTAAFCRDWARTLQACYWDTFRTDNGWVAGWKSADGKLHDHAFLAVNGLAASCGLIPPHAARPAMEGLWNALAAAGFDGFDAGLPGNVFPIPTEDLALPQQPHPFGGYQNGGITLSQSCHFLRGLLAVGMQTQAETIMERMAAGLCDELSLGGVGSGVDWMTWDGVASGYEGQLCDQFGVLAVMLERWGA